MMSAPDARTTIDGTTYDYFGGTGYLGLQAHIEVIEAGCRALRTFGVHSATSRTRYANPSVLNVELQASRFFGTEKSFYLISGYLSTGLLLRAVQEEVDAIFLDEASHYSITEAAASSGLPVIPFKNRDHADLRSKIADTLTFSQTPLVLSDGVFASFGWIAPIDRYRDVLESYHRSIILIDDAHGFGVLGNDGRGTLDHFGYWQETNRLTPESEGTRLLVAGTLSKALGGQGGIVPCDAALYEKVTTVAHYFDGASAPAAPVAAASARALQIAIGNPDLRVQLRANINRARQGLRQLGIQTEDTPTPIIGFEHGTSTDMQSLHRNLAKAGILVPYSDAYSGVGSEGAMRMAIFATHQADQIDRMLDVLKRELRP
jgi:8-amino-7-oxononanoate synthase